MLLIKRSSKIKLLFLFLFTLLAHKTTIDE